MKFPGYFGYGIKHNLENCGGDVLNRSKTGFICLFWGYVFFATLGNNDRMDIQNMNIRGIG